MVLVVEDTNSGVLSAFVKSPKKVLINALLP